MDSSFRNVIEFRHPSWWHQDVYKELGKHRIGFCGISHPALPDEVIQNTPFVYYRFHGVPEIYKSLYDKAYLYQIADSIHSNPKTKQAFVFFNNDIGGSAIQNAADLENYCNSLEKAGKGVKNR